MDALTRKKNASLAAKYTTDSLAFRKYKEALSLRRRALWRDAGDALVRASELFAKLRMVDEAALVCYEAADCFENVDKSEALRALALAVRFNCEAGRFDVAGRVERRIAAIHEKSRHFDDAALHFRKAANFLSGNQEVDASDLCLSHCAECLVLNGDLYAAHEVFETIAASCVASNLRRFHARRFLFKAVLALFGAPFDEFFDNTTPQTVEATAANAFKTNSDGAPALNAQSLAQLAPRSQSFRVNRVSVNTDEESASVKSGTTATSAKTTLQTTTEEAPSDHVGIFIQSCALRKPKYDEIASKIDEYDKLDFLWIDCKEKRFLKNLLQCRLDVLNDEFFDHIYHWNAVRPLDLSSILSLRPVLDELDRESVEKTNHDLTLQGRKVGGRKKRKN